MATPVHQRFHSGRDAGGSKQDPAVGRGVEGSRVFRSPELRLLDFKLSTAEIFAEIRGGGGISSGDAIHLACAAEVRVDLFLTHDKRLARKIIPGIQFIAALDTNVL